MATVPSGEPLTVGEVAGMVGALDLFDASDVEALADYLYAETAAQRALLVETYYDALVRQLTGTASQEILDAAADLANTAADSLLRSYVSAELENMGRVISEGIAEGLNPRDIARRLEDVQGLDSNRARSFEKFRRELEQNADLTDAQIVAREEREFQRLLRERRETIARTESAKAVSEGDFLEAERVGAKWKIWQTTGDGRVSDECQANEAAGPIGLKDTFPGGVTTVPQHPNCRCSVMFLSSDQQLAGARERAEARAARTEEAKGEAAPALSRKKAPADTKARDDAKQKRAWERARAEYESALAAHGRALKRAEESIDRAQRTGHRDDIRTAQRLVKEAERKAAALDRAAQAVAKADQG